MADETRPKKKFQWEWVGIALAMYIIFYFLILLVIEGGQWNNVTIARIWTVVGAFLIAAIAGFLSRGVTVWGVAISALIATGLIFLASTLNLTSAVPLGGGMQPVITLLTVFVFAALGALIGKRIRSGPTAAGEEARPKKKFQWGSVGIALAMFIVFYFLVLLVLEGGQWGGVITARIWTVVGAFLIAGIAGFLSKGVTVWEIAVSALIVTGLIFLANELNLTTAVPLGGGMQPIITLITVFVFSILGAWIGERIQRAQKKG